MMERIIYVLSRCRDLFLLLSRKIIQSSGTISSQYFFELSLTFKIVDGAFIQTGFNGSLLGSGQPLSQITGMDNKAATMEFLRRTLAEYRHYRPDSPFFVPIVMDYSVDPMNHQGGWIFYKQKCLIYEPYGTYSKYDVDYRDALAEIPRSLGYTVTTWHAYHGLEYGLQTMLLRAAKEKEREFAREFAAFGVELEPSDRRETLKVIDKSVDSMFLVKHLEAQRKDNPDLGPINDAYALFARWTCKSCVTLTLMELLLFSRGTDAIHRFYREVAASEYPSQFINRRFIAEMQAIAPFEIDPADSIGQVCGRLTGVI